jgi:general secretion pathway protein K
MTAAHRDQDGFALPIVLWIVGILALLGTFVIVTARDRLALERRAYEATVSRDVADGAARHAIFQVLSGRWRLDGSVRPVRVGDRLAMVRLEDEGAKVNPNVASAVALRRLFEGVSLNPRVADALAPSIVAWRAAGDGVAISGGTPQAGVTDSVTPPRSFRRLEDLLLVPGMTQEILDVLRPHLTLFAGADPDLTDVDEGAGAVRIMSVIAEARGPDGGAFKRHVIAETNARRTGPRYEILMSERLPSGAEPAVVADRPRIK